MADVPTDLVRIDETGTAHAISRTASQRMRARKGTFRLLPAPAHVVFMRQVGEDGRRDPEDGALVRLAGEINKAGCLCDVVALIGHSGWKGEFVVLDGQASRSIFFEQGKVLAAQSTALGERLGEILYQFGALSPEQIEACTQVEGKRLGEAAVDFGFITRDKLYALMGRQAEEIVYNTLRLGEGMFYFLDQFDESRLTRRHNLPANALLMEGVRRMDELSYFRERIPSDEHVPVRVPGRAEPSRELAAVYHAVDGEKSVADLGRLCQVSLFEATQSVFQLVQAGLLAIRPPRPTDPMAVVETFNTAMRAVMRAASSAGQGDELRQTLASFASSSGVYDPLFFAAGPEADGSVRAERIVTNIASLAGDDPLHTLSQWLYDYAAFGLFAARSLVPGDAGHELSRQVAELIAPLNRAEPEPNRPSLLSLSDELNR
ncbi:MAG TPA: DUF4388 domain-containing protein [Polyangiaceae bacterium]|nr:DUF4388 domain-containing protein [Polyangiaceae bacterium]